MRLAAWAAAVEYVREGIAAADWLEEPDVAHIGPPKLLLILLVLHRDAQTARREDRMAKKRALGPARGAAAQLTASSNRFFLIDFHPMKDPVWRVLDDKERAPLKELRGLLQPSVGQRLIPSAWRRLCMNGRLSYLCSATFG
jgi:hypothetical protein